MFNLQATHTSGMRMSDEDEEPDHTFTLVRERYHRLLRQFDFNSVGRRYDYCNVNYAVLVGVLHLLRNLRCIYFFCNLFFL